MAFDASRDERCFSLLRPILFRFGVAWFWVALVLERRAVEVWRELRAQNASARRTRLTTVWSDCVDGLAETLLKGDQGRSLQVQAWSLPDNRKMRGLGLGHMWTVLCPYCHEFHTHSPGEGRRTPHCCSNKDRNHYILEFAGTLPFEHHGRFYHSSKAGLPRLLHQWPGANSHSHGAQPLELLAA